MISDKLYWSGTLLFLVISTFVACTEDEPEDPCLFCPPAFNLIDIEPAWSPDGEWIAFVHGDLIPAKRGLYLISPAGDIVKQLGQGDFQDPAWSPDGQWIAFSRNAQIWKMKINGDSLEQLTFEGRNFFPAWSNDGKLIAHHQSICEEIPCGIWLINLDDSTHRSITSLGNFPDFHPSDNTILYKKRWVGSNGEVYGDSLFYYDYSGDHSAFFLTLQDPNYDNRYLKINSSGTKIAFSSRPIDQPYYYMWIMNADGTNKTQLTDSQAYGCAWSPDGEFIVYTDTREENGRLWVMDKDGMNKRQLTFGENF